MNSRHKLRELAMTSLYQHFLLQKDIKECVYDNSETCLLYTSDAADE